MTVDPTQEWPSDAEPYGDGPMFEGIPEIDETIAAVRQLLRADGPEVDYELIAGYLEGFLTATERTDVDQKIRTWANWHDAYWEARAFSRRHTG